MEVESSLNRSEDVCNESAYVSGIQTVITLFSLCVFGVLLSVLIMSGNLLVIISIMYFKQLHTPTNYLILSLAVADLLIGVIVVPISTILVATSCLHSEDFLCKIRGSFDLILCAASIFHLCCISVDRYYAVCQPLSYRSKMNVCVIFLMILFSWAFSAFPAIVVTIQGSNGGQSKRCVLFQKENSREVGVLFGFYLPAIVMSSIYLKIFTVAQRQAHSINATCQSKQSEAAVSKRERKATKTLAVVMGVFLICWSPFFLCITFNPLSNYTIPEPLIETFKCLAWSNSMLNPLVYGLFYSWFRSSFRMIITGKIFKGDFTNSKLF